METILQILQWAIPAGGLGTAIGWFWNRRVNQAKAKKEIHDTFKQMYEDVSTLCLNLQKENDELKDITNKLLDKQSSTQRALNRLSRAIEAIPLCDYHSQCPVLGELRLDEGSGTGGRDQPDKRPSDTRRKAAPDKRGKPKRSHNSGPGRPGGSDSGTPGGGGVQQP